MVLAERKKEIEEMPRKKKGEYTSQCAGQSPTESIYIRHSLWPYLLQCLGRAFQHSHTYSEKERHENYVF